jgi:hypothetical protein
MSFYSPAAGRHEGYLAAQPRSKPSTPRYCVRKPHLDTVSTLC